MCWQIAIDGPAGAGKSTISKNLARKLGFQYVDTGAMYRAVTLKALRLGINMYENDEYNFLENTAIDLRGDRILLDGEDVTEETGAMRPLTMFPSSHSASTFGTNWSRFRGRSRMKKTSSWTGATSARLFCREPI